MTKLVVGLDLDGTLNDSRLRHKLALYQSAKSLGVILTPGLIENFVEMKSSGDSGLHVLQKNHVTCADKIMGEWVNVIENRALLDHDALFTDVMRTLRTQKKNGLKFHIVTSRQYSEKVIEQIEHFGLDEVIEDAWVVQPDSKITKSKISSHLGIHAVVGDTEVDAIWAQELGVNFYAVNYGFRNEAFWAKNGKKSWPGLSSVFCSIHSETRYS